MVFFCLNCLRFMRFERYHFGQIVVPHYFLIASAVFATAKDRRGKQLFPRQWDLNYIGLPAVEKSDQNTPTLEAVEIETILTAAKERYRVLYALLAGTGIRISEALGLEVGKHLTANCSILYTGPRTPEGKTKVAMNALVHGERSAIIASVRQMVRWTIGELRLGRWNSVV